MAKRTREIVVEANKTIDHKNLSIAELFANNSKPIELLDNAELNQDAIELERFMNEYLTIAMQAAGDDETNEIELPSVNGINQPIVRGATVKVKRKYVEALARSKTTTFTQSTPDSTRPDSITMVENVIQSTPFSVFSDPSGDKGRAWLTAILNQK